LGTPRWNPKKNWKKKTWVLGHGEKAGGDTPREKKKKKYKIGGKKSSH